MLGNVLALLKHADKIRHWLQHPCVHVVIEHAFELRELTEDGNSYKTISKDAKILGIYFSRDHAEKHRSKLTSKLGLRGYIAVLKMTIRGKLYV